MLRITLYELLHGDPGDELRVLVFARPALVSTDHLLKRFLRASQAAEKDEEEGCGSQELDAVVHRPSHPRVGLGCLGHGGDGCSVLAALKASEHR